MNTNSNNSGVNIEDYEDLAVRKSKMAKKTALGAAGVVGVGAIAGGTAYAATAGDDTIEDAVTTDDLINGADTGMEMQPVEEAPAPQTTTQYVQVQQPAPEPESETEITWDEATNYYVDGEKVISTESGTVDGHNFTIVDFDGDDHADLIAVDSNNNGRYDDNEIMELSPSDHVHMGHETAKTTNEQFYANIDSPRGYSPESESYAYNGGEPIHNNFEDEKTGENYYGDYAENNPDYNPRADVDYGENNGQYLAEDYRYSENESYAGIELAENDEPNVDVQDDMACGDGSESDSYDAMMGEDEFMG